MMRHIGTSIDGLLAQSDMQLKKLAPHFGKSWRCILMENQQRLIDADALISRALEEKRFVFTMYDLINNEYIVETVYKDLADFINEAPTIDAEPVRHGEWVGTDFDGYADGNPVYYLWQCSCCHEEYERDGLPPWYDYCPNCGAKMGGAEE